MRWHSEKHHAIWERRNYTTPLEKRVRQMGAFLLDAPYPNHRLLHASMRPPEKPEHDVLLHMQDLAMNGIHMVIDHLNHPIAEHLDRQLIILTIDPDVAMHKIDTGDYSRG